jgi:hypothetical protein
LLKVVGASGVSGAIAWKIVTLSDAILKPTSFLASTVNSYVVPKTKFGTV